MSAPMYRTRGLLFPLLVIAIGVIVLLANLRVLSSAALERLGDLWPLLLVILGLQLILNHTMPRQQATMTGLAAAAVIVAGALAYALLAPANQFGTQHAESSPQLGGITAGTLELNYSAASINVGTGGLGETMYRARVDYPAGDDPPTISLDQQNGTVGITQNTGFRLFHLFGSNQRHLVVTLNSRIPWTIRVKGGVSNLNLDLRELKLSGLELSGGATDITAQIGQPKGSVGIHMFGGVSNVTLRAPSGTEWRISASGGVSGVTINGAGSGNVGGGYRKQSSGYDGASDRLDIELSGGVSNLDFRTS